MAKDYPKPKPSSSEAPKPTTPSAGRRGYMRPRAFRWQTAPPKATKRACIAVLPQIAPTLKPLRLCGAEALPGDVLCPRCAPDRIRRLALLRILPGDWQARLDEALREDHGPTIAREVVVEPALLIPKREDIAPRVEVTPIKPWREKGKP